MTEWLPLPLRCPLSLAHPFAGGLPRAGKPNGRAGRCACSSWQYLTGKTRSLRSFVAPPIRSRPTNEPGASGGVQAAFGFTRPVHPAQGQHQ
jgi:hypothetical protein